MLSWLQPHCISVCLHLLMECCTKPWDYVEAKIDQKCACVYGCDLQDVIMLLLNVVDRCICVQPD